VVAPASSSHLPNAGEELERVVDLLAPDGVLLIAVPNSDGLQARILGDRWFALDLPRHLVHLSARALVQRLQALGLKVERVSSWRGGQVIFGWLHGIVGILPGHPDLYEAIRRPEAAGARARPMAVSSCSLPRSRCAEGEPSMWSAVVPDTRAGSSTAVLMPAVGRSPGKGDSRDAGYERGGHRQPDGRQHPGRLGR
jgi:hypothetical protein